MTIRVRTTISLTPEALAIFKRMADAANVSVSRCMGDWLSDTAEAAEMLTVKMEEAKRAPMRVMREMRAMVAGMGLMVDDVEGIVRGRGAVQRPGAARKPGPSVPPSSNTGVLVPPETPSSPVPAKSKRVRKSQ